MYDIKKFKIKKVPVILGIESSCDETACAIIRGREILSDCIMSSAGEQALYGGVVPEIASRAHTDAVDEVVQKALNGAGISANEVDAVAVTYGAGLLGALLVGLSFAKSFAHAQNIPPCILYKKTSQPHKGERRKPESSIKKKMGGGGGG
ncbi:MAG: hypothetical protein K2N50_02290, partial [Clostridia bacterium]|nr:hypothetical protein [Clostridia bacterium]